MMTKGSYNCMNVDSFRFLPFCFSFFAKHTAYRYDASYLALQERVQEARSFAYLYRSGTLWVVLQLVFFHHKWYHPTRKNCVVKPHFFIQILLVVAIGKGYNMRGRTQCFAGGTVFFGVNAYVEARCIMLSGKQIISLSVIYWPKCVVYQFLHTISYKHEMKLQL